MGFMLPVMGALATIGGAAGAGEGLLGSLGGLFGAGAGAAGTAASAAPVIAEAAAAPFTGATVGSALGGAGALEAGTASGLTLGSALKMAPGIFSIGGMLAPDAKTRSMMETGGLMAQGASLGHELAQMSSGLPKTDVAPPVSAGTPFNFEKMKPLLQAGQSLGEVFKGPQQPQQGVPQPAQPMPFQPGGQGTSIPNPIQGGYLGYVPTAARLSQMLGR